MKKEPTILINPIPIESIQLYTSSMLLLISGEKHIKTSLVVN